MQNKRRKPSGAMDGFVPRSRADSTKRISLDSTPKKRVHANDGFVPRAPQPTNPATQPLKLDDDQWADENTLTISNTDDLNNPDGIKSRRGTLSGGAGKPKWWQFGKKRRQKKGKPEPSRRKKIIKRTLFIILLVLILVGGFLGWKVLKNATKVFNGNILGLLDSTKLKGEDQGRVNILLAGNSADDKGHDGANLTDSIMIASINTRDNSAFMISIPRDLYVDYETRNCSVGYKGKINAAYICGEQIGFKENGYPEGGMGLLAKIVNENFGINVNYYALVNYGAFRDSVDAVDGITINIQSDNPRGISDPSLDYTSRNCCALAKYPNGPAKLNGKQALNLARARGDNPNAYGFAAGDFTRTEHQRKMLIALKDKTLSAGVLSNPAKIASLFDSVGSNVKTDFSTSEVRRLYDIGKKVQNNNIKSIGLTDENVALVTTTSISGAGSVVVPVAGTTNFSQIKSFIKKLTSSDPLIQEGADVVVLNGSGTVGLAQQKADELAVKGITVSAVGNATARDTTVIVDLTKGKKNATKTYLEKKYGVTAITNTTSVVESKNYQSDFIVVLGKNAASSTAN